MLFCGETGMKIALFPADPRVIFCQSSDNFTKMILLFKINEIGLNVNAQLLLSVFYHFTIFGFKSAKLKFFEENKGFKVIFSN